MTLRRQQRKEWGALAGALFAALTLLPGAARDQTITEQVVVNRVTGLAISGFDPVAYFTESRPVRGVEQFEASREGAVWRFRNEGNRAAFISHPDVYTPVFGGYDPVDVARGASVGGAAEIWLIYKSQLMLFSSETSRQAFSADPDGFLAAARKRWPALRDELSD